MVSRYEKAGKMRDWVYYIPFMILAVVVFVVIYAMNADKGGTKAVDLPLPPELQSHFAGPKKYLIHFFASWCVECVAEMPTFVTNKHDITIYGVAVKDWQFDKFLAQYGNPYDKVIEDKDGSLIAAVGVTEIPTTFLVVRERIRQIHTGPVSPNRYERFHEFFESFLD